MSQTNQRIIAVVVLLSGDLQRVAVGFNPKSGFSQFFATSVEPADCEAHKLESDAAKSAALAMLCIRAGINSPDLQVFEWIDVRNWDAHFTDRKGKVRTTEYRFLAVANNSHIFPKEGGRTIGRSTKSFIDIPVALRLWERSMGDPEWLSYHQVIALVQSLLFLKKLVGDDEAFTLFTQMLDKISDSGIDLDSYTHVIHEGRIARRNEQQP